MEKTNKKQEKQAGAGGGSIFDAAPAPLNNSVSISSGPYAEELPVAGMTVGGIRSKFQDRFDIAPGSQAVLNGNQVGDDVVLKPGGALMFIQHAGEKGGQCKF